MDTTKQEPPRFFGRCDRCGDITEAVITPREVACKWGGCNGTVQATTPICRRAGGERMSIKERIGQWFCRQLFARGYVVIPVAKIQRLESSALANHCAQKKHPQDSWDRGYFNGLADMASKTAYEFKQFYPD